MLADLIASYPMISRTAHFILVPGPLDLTQSSLSIFPRKPLMLAPTSRMRSKIPHVHLASNPCRIVFCGQEIVIFRDDLMTRMMRNCLFQHNTRSGESLKRHVRLAVIPLHQIDFSLASANYNRSRPFNALHSRYSTNILGF